MFYLMKHSSCEEKLYIPDFIKINNKATNSNNVEEKLERIAKLLTKFQEAFIKEKEKLKGNKDTMLQEIRTFREKISQLLDQFEKNIVQELEQKFTSLTDKIDLNLRELQATRTEIKDVQDHLKSAGGNLPQKFVSIMQANQVFSEAEGKAMKSEHNVCPTEIYFIANKKLQTQFSEIQDLGSIRVREKLMFIGRQKYPVKLKSDTYPCDIISACTLNDGTIIIADGNNSYLKRLDSSSYCIIDCCDVPRWPWQVCAISDTEVAVSCVDSKQIQFVSIEGIMIQTRQIKTDFLCKGLAYANERLFVSDKTSVYMFSLSGELLQQLYIDQYVQRLFSYITALAINTDMSRMYVTDRAKVLSILDMNDELVGQYNGDKLRGACGVCLGNNDSVLVCGGNSMNVLQFGPYGKLIDEILKTDGECTTVFCNKNKSKLIVACRQRDEIDVYDINAE